MDDQYYLHRMSDILQDGCIPRPRFPANPTRLSRHVILGNQQNAEDLDTLSQLKITHVLCCSFSRRSFESPYPLELSFTYRCLPTEDREDFNIAAYFPEAFVFLKSVKEKQGRVLVHCNMGVNRSGAITAAYLMIDERRYLLNTIAYLKYKRQLILTNRGFRRQLINFARNNNLLDPFPIDIPRSVRRVKVEDDRTPLSPPTRRVQRISKKGDLSYELNKNYNQADGIPCNLDFYQDVKFEKLGYNNQNIRPRNSYKENFQIFTDTSCRTKGPPKSAEPIRRKTTDSFTLQLIPLIPYKKSLPLSDRETLIDHFRISPQEDHSRLLRRSQRFTAEVALDTLNGGKQKMVRVYSRPNAVSDGELMNCDILPMSKEKTRITVLSSDGQIIQPKNLTLKDASNDLEGSGLARGSYFIKLGPRRPLASTAEINQQYYNTVKSLPSSSQLKSQHGSNLTFNPNSNANAHLKNRNSADHCPLNKVASPSTMARIRIARNTNVDKLTEDTKAANVLNTNNNFAKSYPG